MENVHNSISVLDLLNYSLPEHHTLHLRCIAGSNGLQRRIYSSSTNRPGLALTGYIETFEKDRIQIIGRSEQAVLKDHYKYQKKVYIDMLFDKSTPCLIFTYNTNPPSELMKLANKHNIPILISTLNSSLLVMRIIYLLNKKLAYSKIIHGVLIEVFSLGILLIGKSGIGKSEAALELVHKGHKLIADDAIKIVQYAEGYLLGYAGKKEMAHFIEVRGIGILNIVHLFGVKATRKEKKISLCINIEKWHKDGEYERVGQNYSQITYLDTHVPLLTLPVFPGRSLPMLIETIAMNHTLREQYHYIAANEFQDLQQKQIDDKLLKTMYVPTIEKIQNFPYNS